MKKSKSKWWSFLLFLPIIGSFLYTENNHLTTSEYTVFSSKLPPSFNGYRILHLSDLHNHSFGDKQENLINQLVNIPFDIVVLTGDLVDARRYDEQPSLLLVEELVKRAPVYYVTGNHEWRTGSYSTFEQQLKNVGVIVLRNETVALQQKEETIFLHGIDDPAVDPDRTPEEVVEESLQRIHLSKENYHLLLAHRPDFFSLYEKYGVDVAFSGHVHGGQVRLPFIGGLFAPGQGLFPTVTEGVHIQNNTSLVLSRGLGNSLFPFRLFNRPELVLVTLKKEP